MYGIVCEEVALGKQVASVNRGYQNILAEFQHMYALSHPVQVHRLSKNSAHLPACHAEIAGRPRRAKIVAIRE